MQSYGDESQWTNLNKSLNLYLTAVKLDPYTTVETINNSPASILNQTQKQEKQILRELLPFVTNNSPCKFCELINLPPYFLGPSLLETPNHVLTACPKYHELRSVLSENLKSLVVRTDYNLILNSSSDIVTEFKQYIMNCNTLRDREN